MSVKAGQEEIQTRDQSTGQEAGDTGGRRRFASPIFLIPPLSLYKATKVIVKNIITDQSDKSNHSKVLMLP